jgi:exodeoxyribonuclease V alpha subunit
MSATDPVNVVIGAQRSRPVVVLPEKESPVLTRELLYTAVTRARRKVTVCAKRETAERARCGRRSSGPRD